MAIIQEAWRKKFVGKDYEANANQELRDFKETATLPKRLFKMEFIEGSVRVFDISPQIPTGQLPITLVQGWGIIEPKFRKMKAVVDSGARVIAVHANSRGGVFEASQEDVDSSEDIRKARLLVKTLMRKEVGKTDVIGVSGGSSVVLHAAILRPDLFNNIVLVTPLGLNKPTRPPDLAWRFIRKKVNRSDLHLRDLTVDPSTASAIWEVAKHIAVSPKRTVENVKGMCRTDTYSLCEKVAGKGIGITIMSAVDDNIFRISEELDNFKRIMNESSGIRKPPFRFITIRGGHDEESVLDPKRIRAAVGVIRDMDRIKHL